MSEALKGMVVAGHGIGWLPESCVAKELAEGTLVCAGSGDWITGSKSACTGRPANAASRPSNQDLHHEPRTAVEGAAGAAEPEAAPAMRIARRSAGGSR